MRFEDALERVAQLPSPLPDPPDALTPTWRGTLTRARTPAPGTPVRAAAVLVLLVPGPEGDARVVLIERADRGGHHSGEVSFPGGATEPDDPDPVATAFREAIEEVGLDVEAAGVRVVGMLDPVWIPVSGFRFVPVLAVAERRPVLVAAPDEVARIVEAPLAAFLPDAPIEMRERSVPDARVVVRFGAYRIDGLVVWGATARVLGQLGALLAGA